MKTFTVPYNGQIITITFTTRDNIFSHLSDLIKDWLEGKKNLIGIEIGSYAGDSAEMFYESKAFSKLYCIDPWKNGYDENDNMSGDPYLNAAEKAFDIRFSNIQEIQKLKMTSDEAVTQFDDLSIDFIYIDGCHTYEAVKKDLQNYYPKIKHGGIISGHDYGGPTTPGTTKAINEFFKTIPFKTYKDYSWLYIKS